MDGKLKILAIIVSLGLSACPPEKKKAVGQESGSTKAPGKSVPVTLDASYNHPLDTSAWRTLDEGYYFTAPATVTVVQGSYSGDPGVWLRASLWSGSLFHCHYISADINSTTLTLDTCDSISNPTQPTLVPIGATILLTNVTAAGLMLEANFTLGN